MILCDICLSDFIYMISSRSMHVAADGLISLFLMTNIPLYVCVCVYIYTHTHTHTHIPHFLYPFICRWCLGYCKQYCNECWGACILSNHGFLLIHTQKCGILDHMVVLFLVFYRAPILFFIVVVPVYILICSVGGFPFLHTLSIYCL